MLSISTRPGRSLAHLNIALARTGSQICLSSFYEGKRPFLTVSNGARGSAVVAVDTELAEILAECRVRDQVAPHSDHVVDCGLNGRVVLSAADRRGFLPVAHLVMAELLNEGM